MKKKIIIIGGGIAGLSAGVYGQKYGFETEIFEMHSVPGGQCTAWKRKGYLFDYCIEWLMGSSSGSLHKVWYELGALNDKIKVINPEIFARNVDEKNQEFLIYKDMKRWEDYLKKIAPEDKKPIRKLFSLINRFSFSGDIEEVMKPKSLRRKWPMLKISIKMLPFLLPMMKYSKKNCSQFIRELGFKNEFLRHFLLNLYDKENFSAVAFLMMFSLFIDNNAGYPVGGSLDFVMRIADKYQKLGGKLSTGKKVKKIIVEEGKAVGVELADNTVHQADYIIAACDLRTVIYNLLNGKYIPEDIKHAFENWPLFKPLVQVSFGVQKEIKEKQMMNNYLIPTKIGTTSVETFAVQNYSFDAKMAPKGKTTIVLRFESPYEMWERLNHEDYKKEKEQIKEDATALLESIYPGISRDIEVVDVATPLTDVKYTGVYQGAYEGFMPTKENANQSLNPIIKELDKFILAGQWLFPGGGLPPSALSGKWAVEMIAKI